MAHFKLKEVVATCYVDNKDLLSLCGKVWMEGKRSGKTCTS